jgi:FixJ family two-component response regulator
MVEASKLICIVDDDSSVRRALGRLTRSFGFDVETIASGRECLDGAYIDRADCLVLDVSMPGMDGFELYALLQASGRDVPTVFISAHDDEGYGRKARSLGAVAFLSKPCDEKSLMEAINNAIASKDTPGKNEIH